jgi:ABC-type amino acid transport substrate-binding protein
LGEFLRRPVVFVEVRWEDQIESLNNRKTDIIMSSMSITLPRNYVISFSAPYLVVGQMALVRRVDLSKYALGYPTILPGTTGVLKGTTGDFLMQRDFPKSKRKTFTSSTDAVAALKRKSIDLFMSDSTLVWYLAGMHATDDLAAVRMVLSEESLAWGVRKADTALLGSVNDFIQKSRTDGTFNRVFRLWTAVDQ